MLPMTSAANIGYIIDSAKTHCRSLNQVSDEHFLGESCWKKVRLFPEDNARGVNLCVDCFMDKKMWQHVQASVET